MQVGMINIINAYNTTNVKKKYNNVIQVKTNQPVSNVLSFDKTSFGKKQSKFPELEKAGERPTESKWFGLGQKLKSYANQDLGGQEINADVSYIVFNGANLSNTKWGKDAKMAYATFTKADFRGADLSDVPVEELRKAQLRETIYDKNTKFPEYYNPSSEKFISKSSYKEGGKTVEIPHWIKK